MASRSLCASTNAVLWLDIEVPAQREHAFAFDFVAKIAMAIR